MQRTGRARRGAARLNFVLEVYMEGSCILARHAPGRRGCQQGTRAPLHVYLPSNNKACDSAVTMGLLCEAGDGGLEGFRACCVFYSVDEVVLPGHAEATFIVLCNVGFFVIV